MYLRSGSLIFTWRYSLIFLKSPNKITEIVKTVAVGNFCDRIICSGELVTCMFDSLVIQIIHWCLMCHFRKESAEILRRHRNRGRKLLQSKRRSIVVFDEIQDLFELQDSLVIPPCTCDTFEIVMITKNKAEKVVKLSNHGHFVADRLFPERIKKTVYNITDIWMLR